MLSTFCRQNESDTTQLQRLVGPWGQLYHDHRHEATRLTMTESTTNRLQSNRSNCYRLYCYQAESDDFGEQRINRRQLDMDCLKTRSQSITEQASCDQTRKYLGNAFKRVISISPAVENASFTGSQQWRHPTSQGRLARTNTTNHGMIMN